ncbi:MAG: HigA family addiction module antitoxin [Mycobacteriaceae bacterium]
MTTLAPIPPGEILAEEFMIPFGLSQNKLARELAVPPRQINQIVKGTRAITPRTALLLSRYFSTTPEFWINLQTHYELVIERKKLTEHLNSINPHPELAAS